MKDALAIRQCQENIQAICRVYDLPSLVIVANEANKIMCRHRREFIDSVKALVPSHFRRYDLVGLHGLTAKRGWREYEAIYALQCVEHEEPDGCPVLIELDVDVCNPNHGLGPAIGHLIEVLWPGKTNPYRIMKGLRRRGLTVTDVREEAA